jgi:hypothetical protein
MQPNTPQIIGKCARHDRKIGAAMRAKRLARAWLAQGAGAERAGPHRD